MCIRDRAYAYPAYALGVAIAGGHVPSLLGFAACCIVPFAIVCALLSRFFTSVTTRRASVRIKYRRTELKAAGAMSALLGKELRRFASNSMIILNSALGSVFLIIMGVAAPVSYTHLDVYKRQLEGRVAPAAEVVADDLTQPGLVLDYQDTKVHVLTPPMHLSLIHI